MDTQNDCCDREAIPTREELVAEARAMTQRLEDEAREAQIIEDERSRELEWLEDFNRGHAA